MNKIPVGKTIASAYSFTFGHIGTVIGLIWLPLVIYAVAEFFATTYYAQGMQAFVSGDASALGRPLLGLLLFFFVGLFLLAVIGSSITRQAMGLRTGPAIVQFPLGAAEFNLFLSYLSVGLVMLAVYIGVVIAVVVLGAAGGLIGNAALGAIGGRLPGAAALGGIALVLLVVAALAMIVFIAARLTFLLAPVTLSEGKIDLIRAWTLTEGNFWRIFLIGMSTIVPIMLVAVLAEIAILGPSYFTMRMTGPTDTAGQMRQMAQDLEAMSAHLPLLLGLWLVLGPFTNGLLFSAPAFAFRALTGEAAKPGSSDPGPFSPA